MKKLSYAFTNEDIRTLAITLTVFISFDFDEYGIPDDEQKLNRTLAQSALEKLLNQQSRFLPNEFQVIAASLDIADGIIRGDLSVSEVTRTELSGHFFTVNKLLSVFGTPEE